MSVGRQGALLCAIVLDCLAALRVRIEAFPHVRVEAVAVRDGPLRIAGEHLPHSVTVHQQKSVIGLELVHAERLTYQSFRLGAGRVVVLLVGGIEQAGQAFCIGKPRVLAVPLHQPARQGDRLGVLEWVGGAFGREAATFQPLVELMRQRHGVGGNDEAADLHRFTVVDRRKFLAHFLGKQRRP